MQRPVPMHEPVAEQHQKTSAEHAAAALEAARLTQAIKGR